MRLATVEQTRAIDELSQSKYKLTGEILMEAAGISAAREIEQSFYPELKSGKTAIICGAGNNGGDGLVVARHLHSMGYRDVFVFLVAPQEKRTLLFVKQLERVELQGLNVVDLIQHPEKTEQIQSSKLIVDGILGVGLKGVVRNPYKEIIEAVNSCQSIKVSLDAPAGLDCDRGQILGHCVKANMTLSFGLAKPGFFVSQGPLQIGRLRVLPIGFPHEALRAVATSCFAFTERLVRRYLPRRKEESNKSHHGHLLLCAGQKNSWGAAILAASSAYRSGVGYVTVASEEEMSSDLLQAVPEALGAGLSGDQLSQTLENDKISAVAVGPGFGVKESLKELILKLIAQNKKCVVLDADALTVCAQEKLFPLPESWVLTPHAGELSRILDVPAREIEADRFYYAKQAAEKTGCHVLLKGFRSVLAYKERSMVILAGNSALAKAGTGDVLTGLIGSFLAQGLPTLQATASAAFIHGKVADEWVRTGKSRSALCAHDLKDHLPDLLGRLSGGAFL